MKTDDFYRQIVQNAPFGYAYHEIILDDNGEPYDYRFIEVNETFVQLTGLKEQNLIGKTAREALPGIANDEFNWIAFYGKIALEGGEETFTQFSEPLGKWYKVTVYSTEKMFFTTVFNDVTDQKQKEEALVESETRFRVAQEMSPDGFTILHPERNEKGEIFDFSWVFENEAIARINDTNPQDVVGKRVLDLFPAHQGTDVFKTYLDVSNTGKSQVLEEVFVGNIIDKPAWLRLVIVSMGDNIAILTQDVTERKTLEEALLESEEKFRAMFNQSTEGIYLHDLQGRVLDVNEMACEQSGYTRNEWLKLNVLDGLPPESAKNLTNEGVLQLWTKWRPGQKYTVEAEHQRKDGSVYPVEISTGVIRYQDENVIMAIVKDITERKKSEMELKERMEELERFQKITVGRENKMLDLKKEVNELLEKLGENKKYHIVS